MLDPTRPSYMPILLPADGPVLSDGASHDAVMISAVCGTSARLRQFASRARAVSSNLLVDPKTAHFQFEGYVSMPAYRALPYSPGRSTLGRIWQPEPFLAAARRAELIEQVFGAQRELEANLLAAPYFYVRSADDPWLEAARLCARDAIQARSDLPVGAVVCVEIDAIIAAADRAAIAASFATLEADFFWLEVINYDELAADVTDVRAVLELLDELARSGRPVVLAYVGRTGLLAVAHGGAGYAAGTHGLEMHPRSFFREMMGSAVANTYYLRDCMAHLHVRVAEAALRSRSARSWSGVPCDCPACGGSTAVTRMVSRQLSAHAMKHRDAELEALLATPAGDRRELLREMFSDALGRAREVAAELDGAGSEHRLTPGQYHYLEVLIEALGGPPATIPGGQDF